MYEDGRERGRGRDGRDGRGERGGGGGDEGRSGRGEKGGRGMDGIDIGSTHPLSSPSSSSSSTTNAASSLPEQGTGRTNVRSSIAHSRLAIIRLIDAIESLEGLDLPDLDANLSDIINESDPEVQAAAIRSFMLYISHLLTFMQFQKTMITQMKKDLDILDRNFNLIEEFVATL